MSVYSHSETPLIIAGYQRSGTTFLRLHLMRWLSIAIPPESSFMTWLQPLYSDWVAQDNTSNRSEEFVRDLLLARKFNNWSLERADVLRHIREVRPGSYPNLIAEIYTLWSSQNHLGPCSWGDKNNIHGIHLAQLAQLYPNLRVVWLIRDPRAVRISERGILESGYSGAAKELQPSIDRSTSGFLKKWIDYQETVHAALQAQGIPHVRLEFSELIQEPEKVVKAVGEAFSIEIRDEPLDRQRLVQLLGSESEYPWKHRIASLGTDQARETVIPEGLCAESIEILKGLRNYGPKSWIPTSFLA